MALRTSLEWRYPETYIKNSMDLKFPDINAQDFLNEEEELGIMMQFEKEWFEKFHDAISFDSV